MRIAAADDRVIDGFGVVIDGFGVVVDGFGVVIDGFGVVIDGFGVVIDGFGVAVDVRSVICVVRQAGGERGGRACKRADVAVGPGGLRIDGVDHYAAGSLDGAGGVPAATAARRALALMAEVANMAPSSTEVCLRPSLSPKRRSWP